MDTFTTLAVLLLACVLAATAFAQEQPAAGVGGSDFHKNDITYSMEVVTAHVKWASKLPGGPIKGFFIPPVNNGRDMVELMQRLELRPTTVTIDRAWDTNCWGIGDYYSHEFRGNRDDFRIVHGYVEKDLTGPAEFEVMLIPGLNGWSRFPTPARDAILKRVSEGAGLVLLHPYVGDVENRPMLGDPPVGDKRIWEISPLINATDSMLGGGGGGRGRGEGQRGPRGVWEYTQRHFITSGVPLELLPQSKIESGFYEYEVAPGATVIIESSDRAIAAVGTYGKGRVVAFAFPEEGFIPQSVDPYRSRVYWPYWEYQYSLIARALVWAAGREGGLGMGGTALEATGGRATLEIMLDSDAGRKVVIEAAGKSEFGEDLGAVKAEFDVPAGVGRVKLPAGLGYARAGKSIYDFIIKDQSGASLNWGAAVVELSKVAQVTALETGPDIHQRGGVFAVTAKAEGALDGLKLRFKIYDDLERLLYTTEAPAAAENKCEYALADFLGMYALAEAELVDADGRVIDAYRAAPAIVMQPSDGRREREYLAMVASVRSRPWLRTIVGDLLRAEGCRSGFSMGGSVSNSLGVPRGAFGVYWYHRGPTTPEGIEAAIKDYEKTGDFSALAYNTKNELYRRTKDKKFLVRTPCFHDPEFAKRLYDSVKETATNKARYNFDYYFVGDEGSLTSYTERVDFCYSDHTLAAEREWLKGEYGTLEALNKEWGTSFASWDTIVPATTEEAKASGRFASWADHRTFMELTFAQAYQTVRDATVAGDPQGHIALSGTQVATAYNGCDWARLDRIIDDFIAYGGGNQYDLHRSFAKPGAMIGFWTGYGSSGMAVQNAIWEAAFHNVLYPNIFWYACYLDPDLTYSKSARDMGKAFVPLRYEGVGKLLMESKRLADGVGLHFSMPSVHAASITDNFPEKGATTIRRNFQAERDGWVRAIKDAGLQFDFVSYLQIEEGALRSGGCKVFVLPMSMAISSEEDAELRAYADKGGIVIADGLAGVMNERCTWQDGGGRMNDFFGIATSEAAQRDYESSTVLEFDEDNFPSGKVADPGKAVITVTDEGRKWGLDESMLAGIEALEKDVKAAPGAAALVTIDGADAVIVKPAGRGWAVYLNVLYDKYPVARSKGFGGAGYRELLRAVLEHAGVAPEVRVLGADGKTLAQAMVVRYDFDGSQVLGVLKENVGREGLSGRDGVTYFKDADGADAAREAVTVTLPRPYYVTDVRTGERFGRTDKVETSVLVGGALVLGLSETDNTVAISGPESAKRGEHPSFEIRSTKPGRSLVRCHFFAPDGAFVAEYAKNVLLENGGGKVVLPSALSDAAGVYTLKATDVVSGASSEARIALE